MDVGVGSAQATLCSMGTKLPPEKIAHSPHPIFGPCLLWPNSWMDEHATWCGSRRRHRPYCIRRAWSQLSAKGAQQPTPLFAHAYCGHGRPSQLLLSSCNHFMHKCVILKYSQQELSSSCNVRSFGHAWAEYWWLCLCGEGELGPI